MWVLKKLTDKVTIQYIISEKKCFTFGRKQTDIVLDDCSISRKHCTINITPKEHCPFTVETDTGVWLIDNKSKYGTYVYKNCNWVKLKEEQIEQLSDGSTIRFGLLQNIWRLQYIPIFACTSTLSVGQIQEVKAHLAAVDGHFLTKWSNECTVVIVNNIKLTKKILLALIHGVPIVTIKYLNQMIENVKRNEPLPDFKQFKPEIVESTLTPHLVSLNTDDNRRELFKGKTFVIPSEEQLEDLQEIIESAGGSVQLLKLDGNWRKLSNENTIVVHLPCNKIINPDKNAQAFKNLTTVLKDEYCVRVIPESEIYQAIAYSSTERYCNPKSQSFELRLSSCNQNSCGDIIEEETPLLSQNEETFQEPIIDESINKSDRLLRPILKDNKLLRKRNHSPELEENFKRTTLDFPASNVNSVCYSNEIDSISESSKNEQVKTAEEIPKKNKISDNNDNVKVKKSKSLEVGQGVRDNLNTKRKNSNYKLDDFWNYIPKECPAKESTKRKLSLNLTEINQYDPPEKKKRVDQPMNRSSANNRSSKNTDTVPEKSTETSNEPGTSSSSSHIIKKTDERTECKIVEEDKTEVKWYRMKNLPRQGPKTGFKLTALQSRKVTEIEPITEPEEEILTKEQEEAYGKMLLAQGWHKIRKHKKSEN